MKGGVVYARRTKMAMQPNCIDAFSNRSALGKSM